MDASPASHAELFAQLERQREPHVALDAVLRLEPFAEFGVAAELQTDELGLLQRVEPERAHEGHVDAERAVHAGALDAVDCAVLRAQPLVSDDAAVAVEADVVALDFEGGEHGG